LRLRLRHVRTRHPVLLSPNYPTLPLTSHHSLLAPMPPAALYHLAILFAAMALLMTLVIRGKSIFVVAPLCALLAATLSGLDPVATMTGPYMSGFAEYLRNFFLIFALGAAFGKLYEDSGAAAVIADRVG